MSRDWVFRLFWFVGRFGLVGVGGEGWLCFFSKVVMKVD